MIPLNARITCDVGDCDRCLGVVEGVLFLFDMYQTLFYSVQPGSVSPLGSRLSLLERGSVSAERVCPQMPRNLIDSCKRVLSWQWTTRRSDCLLFVQTDPNHAVVWPRTEPSMWQWWLWIWPRPGCSPHLHHARSWRQSFLKVSFLRLQPIHAIYEVDVLLGTGHTFSVISVQIKDLTAILHYCTFEGSRTS